MDFEAAIEAYKQGVDQDIKAYKSQDFVAPKWVKGVLEDEEALTHIKPEQQVANTPVRAQASSSSWEELITDTQALAVSDYLLNEQETKQYYSEEEEETSKDANGPHI